MKIALIIGARPNFVKISPIVKEFLYHSNIISTIIHTGQHYDVEMSKYFFKDLRIPEPHYNLDVRSGTHGMQTAKIIERLEPTLLKEKPHWVMVVGDVNSTLAGALTAVKLHIPIIHLEAGMRSYDMGMPEEVNRVLTDHVSSLLFCATKTAVQNLKKEVIVKHVYQTGDIMYDIFLRYANATKNASPLLKKLHVRKKEYILLTIHRAQTVDDQKLLYHTLLAIEKCKEKIIFPVHPRTKKALTEMGKGVFRNFPHISFIKPLRYLETLTLEKYAKKIVTDSGGVQKEAYWHGIPCITLRKETEWIETVQSGWNILVGTKPKDILHAINHFNPRGPRPRHFGKGNSAKRIVDIILAQKLPRANPALTHHESG